MAEWQVERGIGETRAVRLVGGVIAEMRIEREDDGVRVGDIWDARLIAKLSARRGIVDLGGQDAVIEPLPAGLTEGGIVRVEVVRETIPEAGRPRLPKVRASGDAGREPGCIVRAALLAEALGVAAAAARPGNDWLEAAGWSEAIGEAASGRVVFPGGMLAIVPTPAMTTIDVDGDLPLAELALAGARAAAQAILKFDIGGSVGIDLPTVGDKDVRQAAAAIFDEILPQPFERTAVNGFGFIQIVRPRRRASIIERVQGAPVQTAALALLRLTERSSGVGVRKITAHPRIVEWLQARPLLGAEIERRLGASIAYAEDPAMPLAGGHVHAAQI